MQINIPEWTVEIRDSNGNVAFAFTTYGEFPPTYSTTVRKKI
jgi:hypothetical protein